MYQFILLIHVFIAVIVIALVLVQQGKGATMGAAFGSGASQTVFGSRGSGSFLFRLTIGLAILFFITSISLNYVATQAYRQSREPSQLGIIPTLPAPGKKQPVNNINTSTGNTTNTSGSTTDKPTKQTLPLLPNEIPERK